MCGWLIGTFSCAHYRVFPAVFSRARGEMSWIIPGAPRIRPPHSASAYVQSWGAGGRGCVAERDSGAGLASIYPSSERATVTSLIKMHIFNTGVR